MKSWIKANLEPFPLHASGLRPSTVVHCVENEMLISIPKNLRLEVGMLKYIFSYPYILHICFWCYRIILFILADSSHQKLPVFCRSDTSNDNCSWMVTQRVQRPIVMGNWATASNSGRWPQRQPTDHPSNKMARTDPTERILFDLEV